MYYFILLDMEISKIISKPKVTKSKIKFNHNGINKSIGKVVSIKEIKGELRIKAKLFHNVGLTISNDSGFYDKEKIQLLRFLKRNKWKFRKQDLEIFLEGIRIGKLSK